MKLLEYARDNGVAMGSVDAVARSSVHVGWTTNGETAERLRLAGARVVTGYGADPNNPGVPPGSAKYPKSSDTPMGWEVSFAQDAEAAVA